MHLIIKNVYYWAIKNVIFNLLINLHPNKYSRELHYYSFAVKLDRCVRSCNTLKGYLHYKTITSQNVSSEAQIKNFFISKKNYIPFSRYSSFYIFNYPMIHQICDVTMSISTWDKVHFWIYLLNQNSWSDQTWPIDRYKQWQ